LVVDVVAAHRPIREVDKRFTAAIGALVASAFDVAVGLWDSCIAGVGMVKPRGEE